jgi:EmrB/QacA subfamily drug resistance transporter
VSDDAALSLPNPTPRMRVVIPLVVGCAFFMEGLDSTVLAVSIPAMAKTFAVQPLRLNLAITAYLLSLAVFIPVSGWIADRYGTRSVFCAAVLIFTASSALCGLSVNLAMLVAMRVLQGFGGAMMTPVGRLILLRSFPRSGLVSAMNWMTIPAMVGPTVGPVVGGLLTAYVSWRAIFYLNIPIGLLGAALALWLFEDYRAPAPTRFDIGGFIIAGVGLFLLEIAIENLGRPMLPTAIGYAFFPLAVAALVLYVRHAKHSRAPVLDLALLRIRTFRIGTMTGGICRMGLDSTPLLIPLLFQVGFGMTPVQSGLLSFSSSLGAMCVRTGSRALLRAFGFRNVLTVGAVCSAAVIAVFALLSADTPRWIMLVCVLVSGCVRSLQYMGLNTVSFADVPSAQLSRSTSFSGVIQQLSRGFGIALGAALLSIVAGTERVTVGDFRIVFVLIALLPLVSGIGFLSLTEDDGAEVSGHPTHATAEADGKVKQGAGS